MRIYDYFKINNSYIFEIRLSDKYHLFIEGLDNLGCGIFDKDCKLEDVKDVEYISIELINNDYNFCEKLDIKDINVNTTIEELKDKVINTLIERIKF